MGRIVISNCGASLPVSRGTILDAALEAGIPYPHGCRVGSCGTCRSRLLEGRVEMAGFAPEALSEDEIRDDVILACRSQPVGDVRVEWLGTGVEAPPAVRRLRTRVVGCEPVAPDISRLRLEVQGAPLYFLAGQYAELRFGGLPARPYSMANAPGDPILEFHIRRRPNGVSSRYVAERVRPGERVRVRGPYGTAYLRFPVRRMLAVAGGSGYAPIRSIVRAALARNPEAEIHLYVGVRDEADLYCEAEAQAMAECHRRLRFVPVLAEPSTPTQRRTGSVHAAVGEDLRSLGDFAVYVAGPPPMVSAVTGLALGRGATAADIHADPFEPAGPDRSMGPGRLRLLKCITIRLPIQWSRAGSRM